jgi:hypothetical protein
MGQANYSAAKSEFSSSSLGTKSFDRLTPGFPWVSRSGFGGFHQDLGQGGCQVQHQSQRYRSGACCFCRFLCFRSTNQYSDSRPLGFSNLRAQIAASAMTETIMPPEVLKHLTPEFIAPLVGVLCSDAVSERPLFSLGMHRSKRYTAERGRHTREPT